MPEDLPTCSALPIAVGNTSRKQGCCSAEDAADAIIRSGAVGLVVNIPKAFGKDELTNGYRIRRAAADSSVPLITNIQLARRFVEALAKKRMEDLACKAWDEYS